MFNSSFNDNNLNEYIVKFNLKFNIIKQVINTEQFVQKPVSYLPGFLHQQRSNNIKYNTMK